MKKEEFSWNGVLGKKTFKTYNFAVPILFLAEAILTSLWFVVSIFWLIGDIHYKIRGNHII